MNGRFQVELGILLLVVTAFGVWAGRGEHAPFVFVIGFVLLLFLIAQMLVRYLPTGILHQIKTNSIRYDGSWSEGRASVEKQALKKLKRNVAWLFALVVVPNLFLLWFVNHEVVPFAIGVNAMTSVEQSAPDWKASLKQEEVQFAQWSGENSLAKSFGISQESHKRFLWRNWPGLFLLGLVWLLTMYAALQSGYFWLLRKFLTSSRLRAQQYKAVDLDRMTKVADRRVFVEELETADVG